MLVNHNSYDFSEIQELSREKKEAWNTVSTNWILIFLEGGLVFSIILRFQFHIGVSRFVIGVL